MQLEFYLWLQKHNLEGYRVLQERPEAGNMVSTSPMRVSHA